MRNNMATVKVQIPFALQVTTVFFFNACNILWFPKWKLLMNAEAFWKALEQMPSKGLRKDQDAIA